MTISKQRKAQRAKKEQKLLLLAMKNADENSAIGRAFRRATGIAA
jgi:hypothetical protein